jgi:MFS family permease
MTHSPEHAAAAALAPSRADDAPRPQSMRRVATASFVGTVIEFYDFGIYGTAAALVFPHVFFPALGSAAGTVASFATYAVAFVARPFGSILFGHLGDRLGRKTTLIATLLLMGLSTILVGLTPTAGRIGVAAPITIIVLRILQGLAAGGEFAGAVLFASEHAPKDKRGFWAMFPSFGGGGAILLANLTFFITAVSMSNATFVNWGWRVPFLASFLLVVVGIWARLRMVETPVFKEQLARSGAARIPFLEAFKNQPRQVLLATGSLLMVFSLTYVGGTYLVNYGTQTLGLARTYVLGIAIVGGATISLGVVLGGRLSDRIGRRRVIGGVACVAIVWTLALFPILDQDSRVAFAIGLPVTMFISGVATGPCGAFLSELFHTRYRYSAAGFSYSLAGMIGGGIPPLIATAIIRSLGGFAFGVLMACICVVSLACLIAVGETKDLDLDRPAAVGAEA